MLKLHVYTDSIRFHPSHHQRSPPPVFLDSMALIPHTCHSSHSQLFPITMDYLYTTLLLLCLVELYGLVYVYILLCSSSRSVPCSLGHQYHFAFCGVPLCFLFCFLPFCFLIKCFTCSWTQTSVYTVFSLTAP